jgi:hypothetical protein
MKHLSSFTVWVIEFCYCGGEIDTYEIHTNMKNAEKRLKELKSKCSDTEQYWIKETIAYK